MNTTTFTPAQLQHDSARYRWLPTVTVLDAIQVLSVKAAHDDQRSRLLLCAAQAEIVTRAGFFPKEVR